MRTRMFSVAALLLFTLFATSCAGTEGWQTPGIVTIDSDEDVMSMFPNPFNWFTDASATGAKALQLRHGDYVRTDNDLIFRYKSSDGNSLKLIIDDGRVKLGDVVVAVSVSESGGLAWLEKASLQELA